jgi:hypothetical protein
MIFLINAVMLQLQLFDKLAFVEHCVLGGVIGLFVLVCAIGIYAWCMEAI